MWITTGIGSSVKEELSSSHDILPLFLQTWLFPHTGPWIHSVGKRWTCCFCRSQKLGQLDRMFHLTVDCHPSLFPVDSKCITVNMNKTSWQLADHQEHLQRKKNGCLTFQEHSVRTKRRLGEHMMSGSVKNVVGHSYCYYFKGTYLEHVIA